MPIGLHTSDVDAVAAPDSRDERPTKRRRRSPQAVQAPFRPARRGVYDATKRAAEFTAALVLLALTAPVILVAALLVKLTSRGPAYYTQTRVGLRGRPFTIYKLRTMIHNCESLTGPRWSIPGDPRVTQVGQFLRASHLDELPQLVNVLCGDMSLIGPRPERPEFVKELERALPAYRHRLTVRPGVTGLAQVQLPADTDLESVRRKLTQDLYYIRERSLWLDCRLLCCTACRVLGVPFGVYGKLFRIPSHEVIEEALKDVVGEAPAARPRKAAA